MNLELALKTILFSFIPIFELRGALPYAYFNEASLLASYLVAVGANALVAPVLYLFLDSIHTLVYHWNFYRRIFDATVRRARHKLEPKIKRFGYFGVMLFIAVPLPITGAYTGTLGAWILGLKRKKTMIAALGGVIISGIIVSLILLAGTGAHSLFIKKI